MAKAGVETVDIVVGGGGVAADSVLRGLLGDCIARGVAPPARVVVVEPLLRLGVGRPWAVPEGQNLVSSNMQAKTLGLHGSIGRDGEFDLVNPKPLMPAKLTREQPYAPRWLVGERLAQNFEKLRARASEARMGIEHAQTLIADVDWRDGWWEVALADGRTLRTRCLVLCLGLIAVDRFPHLHGAGYHADGWQTGDLIDRLEPADRVAIVGAGPTAIDWAIALRAAGLDHPVTIASRSGRMPAARPNVSRSKPDSHYSKAAIQQRADQYGLYGPGRIEEMLRGIFAEAGVTRAEARRYIFLGRQGGRALLDETLGLSGARQRFFNALKTIDHVAPLVWRLSSPAGKEHIMRLAPLHAQLSFAVPPPNAQAILADIGAGRLRIVGGLASVSRAMAEFTLAFDSDAPDVKADVVINATGFAGDLADCTSPLIRSMLAKGFIVGGQHGGIDMLYDTGEVRAGGGQTVDGLFVAGGSLSRSAAYLVNSLVDTSEHGIRVGTSCARFIALKRDAPLRKPPAPAAGRDDPPAEDAVMRWVG